RRGRPRSSGRCWRYSRLPVPNRNHQTRGGLTHDPGALVSASKYRPTSAAVTEREPPDNGSPGRFLVVASPRPVSAIIVPVGADRPAMTRVMMMPVMVVTHCSDVGGGGGVGHRLWQRRDKCGLRNPANGCQYEP